MSTARSLKTTVKASSKSDASLMCNDLTCETSKRNIKYIFLEIRKSIGTTTLFINYMPVLSVSELIPEGALGIECAPPPPKQPATNVKDSFPSPQDHGYEDE